MLGVYDSYLVSLAIDASYRQLDEKCVTAHVCGQYRTNITKDDISVRVQHMAKCHCAAK